LPSPGKDNGGRSHEKLISALENPTVTNTELAKKSKNFGTKVKYLKIIRNEADYQLQKTFSKSQALQAYASAKRIINIE